MEQLHDTAMLARLMESLERIEGHLVRTDNKIDILQEVWFKLSDSLVCPVYHVHLRHVCFIQRLLVLKVNSLLTDWSILNSEDFWHHSTICQ